MDTSSQTFPGRVAALGLFGASGAAALIYQIVWFQLLSLAIGSSAVSLGVLLATFLGGMCIGSLWLPRLLPTTVHPWRLFAGLELGVGVFGLAALLVIPALGGVYVAVGGDGPAGLGLRVVVAAFGLLPATVLMGATLPVIARWLEARREGVAWLGYCYAANIVGAVAGTLLAGFYLLRWHDAQTATFVAVALNVIVAAVSSRLASSVAAPTQSQGAKPAASSRGATVIYVVAGVSGFTALSAEVLWTRHLSLLLGGTVYTFALILAVFLVGLGAGSFIGAALGRRGNARITLGACQLLSCAAMAWAAYTIARALPYWPIDVELPVSAGVALQLDLVRVAWVVLPAALLWGASFPLALAATAEAGHDPRRAVARLYAANTAGAILGALATTFVLVVTFGSLATQQLSIVLAAAAGIALWLGRATRVRRYAVATFALAASLLAIMVPGLPPELVAYGRFLPTRGFDANVVFVGEGLTASVAVTEEPSGILTYHNAGKTQASTYPQDMRLQRMLGHLATLVTETPATVLVIGLGAGVTAGAVSVDPAVERLVVAEIEPLVPFVAAEFFGDANHGVVTDPKVEIRIDDGRHFLATTNETFDAITSDPLDPWVKGAAALYTREFFELGRDRLNDGGVITIFLQLYESTADAVHSEIATFFDVFPNGALFANLVDGFGYDAVLFARKGDAPIDVDRIGRRLASAAYAPVASSLREVGFDSALDLLGTFAGQHGDLAAALEGATINTDRNLRLQYLAANGLNSYAAAEIFGEMFAAGVRFPEQLFRGTPAQLEELRQRLLARQGEY